MRFCSLLVLLLCGMSLPAQHWQPANDIAPAHIVDQVADYRLLTLDAAELAPGQALEKAATGFLLPLPEGRQLAVQLVSDPILPPGLSSRFPDIHSFKVVGAKGVSGRLTWTELGISAAVQTPEGEVFLSALSDDPTTYVVYYGDQVMSHPAYAFETSCGYDGYESWEHPFHVPYQPHGPDHAKDKGGQDHQLYLYEIAILATGEFTGRNGGTVSSALSRIVQIIDLLNTITQREVAARFELIERNDELIFTDADTDPFINANNGGELLGQTTAAIVDVAGVPFNSFDVAQVFTGGCTDVAGVVSGGACTNGKARGVTCFSSNNISRIVRRTMSHELAHQFSVDHSWNNCSEQTSDQRRSGSAYEPGSGTTIMSYAGSCGANNSSFDKDGYYHAWSAQQFISYARQGPADGCATKVPVANQPPDVSLQYIDGFSIPMLTPFELHATGSDPDDDQITYCWEQFDLGPVTDLGNAFSSAPLFRTFPPTLASNRIVPNLTDLLNNESDLTEQMPDYARDITFRCTVRDNDPEAGGIDWATVRFKVADNAGPFLVTNPNVAMDWQAGDYVEVTWDVANTNNSPVNCKRVNILLSDDGGRTFTIPLLEGAENNGSAFVTVPDIETDRARIRVEAANNIFFDLSNSNFNIVPPTDTGFAVSVRDIFEDLCLPDTAVYEINTASLLGYDELIALEVLSGLPAGATYSFEADTIEAGASTQLKIDLTDVINSGEYEIVVQATSDTTVLIRNIYLRVVTNDFSTLATKLPEDGRDDIVLFTEFSWDGSPNAEFYSFQLATEPTFIDTLLVDVASGLLDTTYSPTVLLEENELYYWRVRAHNECNEGEWTDPKVFHTIAVECIPSIADDLPVNIPSGSGVSIESNLFVETEGIISDVNLPFLRLEYQPIFALRISLTSPSGTRVVLFDRNCGATIRVSIGFDDQAPQSIVCPPDDGIVFQPVESLSAFIGENSFGNWKLQVEVVGTSFGASGALEEWQLEFCASLSAKDPTLVKNDTLLVPPGQINTITNDILQVTDEDNTADELRYTLVKAPAHGTLYLAGEPVQAGDYFRQTSIDVFNLQYAHHGNDAVLDEFDFVVEDGNGGFLPVNTFDIKITEDALVYTNNPVDARQALHIFPNPTAGAVRLEWKQGSLHKAAQIELYSTTGQLMQEVYWPAEKEQMVLHLNQLAEGIYIARITTSGRQYSQRISVAR